jgi:hypothetical protein
VLNHLINLNSPHIQAVLPILLKDQTTKRNIIWATDNYAQYSKWLCDDAYYDDAAELYSEISQITIQSLDGLDKNVFQPRAFKTAVAQKQRTKTKAEVFTPSWLCNEMNNYGDDEWFGRTNVFNKPGTKPHSWIKTRGKIEFPGVKGKTWQDYVYSTRMEITCGEAPYLVSRYDTTTGKPIDVARRIGLLDRKLRVVNENTNTYEEWIFWTLNAYRATYGYEYQGDNLLIARINLLETFRDNKLLRWNVEPTNDELQQVANIISWNVWQMDGLTNCVPWNNKLEAAILQRNLLAAQDRLKAFQSIQFETNVAHNVALLVYLISHQDYGHQYTPSELLKHWTDEQCLALVASFLAQDTGYCVKIDHKQLQRFKKEHAKMTRLFEQRCNEFASRIDNCLLYQPQECIIRKWSHSARGKAQKWTTVIFNEL